MLDEVSESFGHARLEEKRETQRPPGIGQRGARCELLEPLRILVAQRHEAALRRAEGVDRRDERAGPLQAFPNRLHALAEMFGQQTAMKSLDRRGAHALEARLEVKFASVSSAIDRALAFAEPMLSREPSTISTFECSTTRVLILPLTTGL